ncbi:aryl-alcohol oxidase-like protein [Marasmius fiardii PR-910]|nr:aryl-alcohol oxidase-like protein [Marasmius fiardii PR-910]
MGTNSLFQLLLILGLLSSPIHGAIFDNANGLPSEKNYDFIIVGSGAGGAVIANRLTENPATSVLVIEAGVSDKNQLNITVPFYTTRLSPNTPFDWNFTLLCRTVPQTHLNNRILTYNRGFAIGGSTTINSMAYTRGTIDDWDRLARITGDQGWSWDSIFPKYVFKNEILTPPADGHDVRENLDPAFHGTAGITGTSPPGFPYPIDDKVLATTKELKAEFPFNQEPNSGKHLGVGWQIVTARGGERSSSSTSYLGDKFVSRKNLDVVLNTRVTRILPEHGDKTTIRTVEFAQMADGPRRTLTASKEIILAGGVIGTPNILLHSGIGPANPLSALGITPLIDNPSVGENFTDHPGISQAWFVNGTDTWELAVRDPKVAAAQLAEWEKSRTGPLTRPVQSQLGWLRLPKDAKIFQQFEDPSAGPNSAHYEILFANGLSDFDTPPKGNFMSILTAVVSPLSRGFVHINSANPFDKPVVDTNFMASEFDLFTMRESLLAARRFLTASVWKGYILEPFQHSDSNSEEELNDYIRNNARPFWHGIGTASMTREDASYGVVNPDLKLKGVKGVRVVDGSVFPLVPTAHTQAPIYILAERASDIIKKEWNL